MQMVHHHIKYKELHGIDEIVVISRSEHSKIHQRLRREGRCNVSVNELNNISARAFGRRRFGDKYGECWIAFHLLRYFERENGVDVFSQRQKDILF